MEQAMEVEDNERPEGAVKAKMNLFNSNPKALSKDS